MWHFFSILIHSLIRIYIYIYTGNALDSLGIQMYIGLVYINKYLFLFYDCPTIQNSNPSSDLLNAYDQSILQSIIQKTVSLPHHQRHLRMLIN